MPRSSGRVTGPSTDPQDPTTRTALSLNLITGRVPNSALNPGSAEEPDSAREEDGAPDMTDVREPLFPTRLPDSPPITEYSST